MATVITVHATYGNGPEEGDYWWQRGSAFEAELRRYVEAESGSLTFTPFGWDGRNSVLSRQEASTRLDETVRVLDEAGEPYCIIGHSHGGSIVSQHFFMQPRRKRSLSRWITVGTPFLKLGTRGFLFARLSSSNQVIYLSLALCCLIAFLTAAATIMSRQRITMFDAVFLVIPLAPFIPYHVYLLWRERQRLRYLVPGVQPKSGGNPFDRRVHLWHSADEAISALGSVTRTKLNIFSSETIRPPIITGYLFSVPVLTIAAIMWLGSNCPSLGRWCPTEQIDFLPLRLLHNGSFYVLYMLDDMVRFGLTALSGPDFVKQSFWLVMAVTGLSAVALYSALCHAAFGVLQRIASGISGAMSRSLNDVTTRQIAELSFGNDDIALRAVECTAYPFGRKNGSALPEDLERLLTEQANKAASESIAKLRDALGTLISVLGSPYAESASSAHYLSWRELIHTSYFDVAEFRLLIFYLISQAPGFRASPALLDHSDRPRLERWAAAVTGTPCSDAPSSAASTQNAA